MLTKLKTIPGVIGHAHPYHADEFIFSDPSLARIKRQMHFRDVNNDVIVIKSVHPFNICRITGPL